MRRERLRPAWSAEQLKSLYAEVHNHTGWTDHRLRVPVTAQVAQWMVDEHGFRSVADLSCGDGAMLDMMTVGMNRGFEKVYGDLVGTVELDLDFVGPIEQTVTEIGPTDLLVCAETLEHLDDPDTFLGLVGKKFKGLVLSTPVGSWGDDTPGHYWAWDRVAVEDMMGSAGFVPVTYLELSWRSPSLPHTFGVWGCLNGSLR